MSLQMTSPELFKNYQVLKFKSSYGSVCLLHYILILYTHSDQAQINCKNLLIITTLKHTFRGFLFCIRYLIINRHGLSLRLNDMLKIKISQLFD